MEEKSKREKQRLEINRFRNQYILKILQAILLSYCLIFTTIRVLNGDPFKEYWSDLLFIIILGLLLIDFKKVRQRYRDSRLQKNNRYT